MYKVLQTTLYLFNHSCRPYKENIDGLTQDCGISSVNAQEIPQSFTRPLTSKLNTTNFLCREPPSLHTSSYQKQAAILSHNNSILHPMKYAYKCVLFALLRLYYFSSRIHVTYLPIFFSTPLQKRHNEHDGVSNYQPHECLLNHLFRRRSKKTSKLPTLAFERGIHRWPVNSLHKGPVPQKMLPFDDVIMHWHWGNIRNMKAPIPVK